MVFAVIFVCWLACAVVAVLLAGWADRKWPNGW